MGLMHQSLSFLVRELKQGLTHVQAFHESRLNKPAVVLHSFFYQVLVINSILLKAGDVIILMNGVCAARRH